jgi:hypothetical protein
MEILIPAVYLFFSFLIPVYRFSGLIAYQGLVSFLLGSVSIVYILHNPLAIPINYPWLLANLESYPISEILLFVLLSSVVSTWLPALLARTKSKVLINIDIFKAVFRLKPISRNTTYLSFLTLVLSLTSAYMFLSGGFFVAIQDAWSIRLSLNESSSSYGFLKLFLAASSFQSCAVWLLYELYFFETKKKTHPKSFSSLLKFILSFIFRPATIFLLALFILSSLLLAGRGNTIQFVEIIIFYYAFSSGRLNLILLYPAIHYSLAVASSSYYTLRALFLSGGVLDSFIEATSYEPPGRIANDFYNRSIIFTNNFSEHLLFGSNQINILRPGELFTSFVKGSFRIMSWDSSQPYLISESFFLSFGLFGAAASIIVTLFIIKVFDRVIGSRSLFACSSTYLSVCYILYFSSRVLVVSPAVGSIALQAVFLPVVLLILIRLTSSRVPSS